ncbi:transcription factor CP2-like protein 1 [Fopius arisanus]|uniref:Transcription factor CP2-like protein 1 n=1 Tax=Fopius arisanus TaxID=64838 RepID=A0A9R1TFC7_9HYME|nr:PREDICTED: transcription factor CP2-like protein 1 [Fopius arisanus]
MLGDYRKHPMLLVYEISVRQFGSVGIQLVARVLYTSRYEQTIVRLGESGRKYLVNLVGTRRRWPVKRLGTPRYCDKNIVRKIFKLGESYHSPQNQNDVGTASSSMAMVPAFVTVVPPVLSGLDSVKEDTNGSSKSVTGLPSSPAIAPDQGTCSDKNTTNAPGELAPDANAFQTCAWLRSSRFQAFETTFSSFSAADILRLSRDDLIQICGLADGIRLFNALHSKPPTPKLTLYFDVEGGGSCLWRVVYLESLTSGALASKLLATVNLPNDRLHSVLLQGPQGIHVLVSNELVANMKDESMFLVETIKDSSSERYKLLLKPSISLK